MGHYTTMMAVDSANPCGIFPRHDHSHSHKENEDDDDAVNMRCRLNNHGRLTLLVQHVALASGSPMSQPCIETFGLSSLCEQQLQTAASNTFLLCCQHDRSLNSNLDESVDHDYNLSAQAGAYYGTGARLLQRLANVIRNIFPLKLHVVLNIVVERPFFERWKRNPGEPSNSLRRAAEAIVKLSWQPARTCPRLRKH
eukprot:2166205-Amphidinium_carterae.1